MQQQASQEPETGARGSVPPRPPNGTCRECASTTEPFLLQSETMGDRWVGPANLCEGCAERAQRAEQDAERQEAYRGLLTKAEIPAGAQAWTFKRAAEAAPGLKSGEDLAGYQQAWQDCKCWHGHQGVLLLRGPTGTGKTVLAVCGFKGWLWDKLKPGLFISVPNLNTALALKGRLPKKTEARELLSRAEEAGLVLLDDLAVGRLVVEAQRALARLIDLRLVARRPLLITTNATDLQIARRFKRHDPHGRLADRLGDVRLCQEVPVLGMSFRQLGGGAVSAKSRPNEPLGARP